MTNTKLQTLKGSPRKLQTLRGFRDFLPEEAQKRQWLKEKMIKVFESWGYEPLETPTLEPLELFVGEIGEDEKLFFKFTDLGGRQVALRYDQSVPACRVLGQYFDKLIFPFRRYQIQPAFRAEKPQKGRYREFVQSDIDIFGIASPLADAEVIAISIDLYLKLGFKDVVVSVNNRDLMKNIPYSAIASIDKLQKIGEPGVINDMDKKGINAQQAKKYLNFVQNIKPDEIISSIFDYLKQSGFSPNNYRFEPTLARSFSYSQGPIWEVNIPGFSSGSVGGGERYDGMVKRLTGRDIPATGIGFGFDRTLEAAELFKLIPPVKTAAKILITVFNEQIFPQSIATGQKLRDSGINTEIYPDPQVKLDKQLKYANKKGIPFAAIIGPDEAKNNTITLKDMKTGKQQELKIENLLKISLP